MNTETETDTLALPPSIPFGISHNHDGPARWKQDGYAETAPMYHVSRCEAGKDCPTTLLFPCRRKWPRDKWIDLDAECSICYNLEEEDE